MSTIFEWVSVTELRTTMATCVIRCTVALVKQKVVNVNAQQTIRRHSLTLSRATMRRAKISVNNDRLVMLRA